MKKKLLLFSCCFLAGVCLFAPANIHAQTLKHSYTFDDGTANDAVGTLNGTLVGTKIAIADGMCTVSGATISTDGYMTLDAAALALNTYSSITLEAYVKTNVTANTNYTMLAYFGNNTGGNKCFWIQPTRGGGTQSRVETSDGSGQTRTATYGSEIDDGKSHHIVAILSSDFIKYYVDGVKVNETRTNGNFISTIDNVIARLFRGPDGWADPNYNASIDKFNIYDGELDGPTILNSTISYLGDSRLASISSDVVGATLLPTFSSNTAVYELFVPEGTTTVNLTATAVDGSATVTITNSGVIDISTGTATASITVTSVPGGVSKTYTVVIGVGNSTCYVPLFSDRTNLIDDPQLVSLSTFGGWGGKSIEYGTSAYCGLSSGLISGGSIDVILTGKVKTNTTYRIKAMVNAASTNANIGVYGWSTGQADITTKATVTSSWAPIDFSFTTGATLGNTSGLFFNNSSGSYIDNWEMFEVSNDSTLSALTIDAGSLAPAFDPATGNYVVILPNGTTSVSVSATANYVGANVTGTGTVTLTDGSGIATVVVTAESGKTKTYTINFITQATIVTSVTGLTIEDLNPKDSIIVTGANLIEDITITAPIGITVDPATIPAASASGVKVYVTFVGMASINDSIVFTSGTLVKKVGIKAISNAACFTPLYASGNLVSNPYFEGLTGYGGWGTRSNSTSPDSVYCGSKSGKITGKCGGSMDVSFSQLKSNSVYRLKAAVLTIGGSYKIGMNNIGTAVPNFVANLDTYGKWKVIDTTIVTGNNTTCNGMFFNSCESQTGTSGYIDNWEMYNITPYASLSDLTVDGTTVIGFDSTVYTYSVVSATIPTVAATEAVAGAIVEVTQATAIPGSATVKVTSADGFAINTYTINFTSVSTDASLSALTVSDGTLKPVFNTATKTYYVELASGSAIPTVTATATDANATVEVTPATAVPDTTIVKVTAEDGTTTNTYHVNFWDLKLVGTIIGHASSWNDVPATYVAAAFDANTTTFVDAPSATGYVGLDLGAGKKAKITSMRYFPRVSMPARMVGGEIRGANNADLSDSVVLYKITTQPSTVSYTDVILSVANSYRYIYYYSANGYCNIAELELYGVTTEYSTDATLSDIQVDGTTVSGFASGTITYDVILPYGTTVVPTVTATANSLTANAVVTNATALPGATTIEVTAQDGSTKLTYTINFTVNTVSVPTTKNPELVSIKPTISNTDFNVGFANKLGKISVYDITGKLISTRLATKSLEVVSVPTEGVYLIKITIDGVVKTQKVVKVK